MCSLQDGPAVLRRNENNLAIFRCPHAAISYGCAISLLHCLHCNPMFPLCSLVGWRGGRSIKMGPLAKRLRKLHSCGTRRGGLSAFAWRGVGSAKLTPLSFVACMSQDPAERAGTGRDDTGRSGITTPNHSGRLQGKGAILLEVSHRPAWVRFPPPPRKGVARPQRLLSRVSASRSPSWSSLALCSTPATHSEGMPSSPTRAPAMDPVMVARLSESPSVFTASSTAAR
jgi:hypothetical protein